MVQLKRLHISDPPRLQYQKRLDCIQRFERFWALANVLVSQQAGDEGLPVSGIRGVTYAATKAESLPRSGVRRVDADFKMLSRQIPYGVVGIYGAVADGMRFIDRKTFTLTPDLGETLAESFLKDTNTPNVLKKAVRGDGDLPIQRLVEWGAQAHVAGKSFPTERKCLAEALHRDSVRSRMAEVLSEFPYEDEGDTELQRLDRLLPALDGEESNRDLHEAVSAILSYEACYRLVMLGFERLLWLCRTLPAAAINPANLAADDMLTRVCMQLPPAVTRFSDVLESAATEQCRRDLHRLEDTKRFLELASAACGSPKSLTCELMARHGDVQRGKFDRGRRKMPWLEVTSGRISLTMTRVGGLKQEAANLLDIAPHPYRLAAADALVAASRG